MKKEKMRLYLDDLRTPTADDWQVVRSYDEFIAHIRMNGLESYEVISLDHDLGPLPQIYVHSANPIGSGNMMGYINNYLMNCKLPQTCIRVKIEHTVEENDL